MRRVGLMNLIIMHKSLKGNKDKKYNDADKYGINVGKYKYMNIKNVIVRKSYIYIYIYEFYQKLQRFYAA